MHFKFIRCVEDLRLKNMHNQWQSCFGSLGLSQTPIRDCFNTGLAIRVSIVYSLELIIIFITQFYDLSVQSYQQNWIVYKLKDLKWKEETWECYVKMSTFWEYNRKRNLKNVVLLHVNKLLWILKHKLPFKLPSLLNSTFDYELQT